MDRGRVAERLNAPVLKTGRRVTLVSGVRISPLPSRARALAILVALGLSVGVAAARTATSIAAVARVAAAHDGGCTPSGRVLARDSGVTVWEVTTSGRTALYACVPTTGVVDRVVHAGTGTSRVLAAGSYVGFDQTGEDHQVFLDVFDAQTGHTELHHLIGDTCLPGTGGSNNVCGINPWVLAPNGWVAELEEGGQGGYPDSEPGNSEARSLLASNGRVTVTDLDGEAAEHLRLSGATLTWSIPGGARYSAPLGPQLDALAAGAVPPPTPLPAPCNLITAVDAQVVLGAVTTASSSSTGCVYTTTGRPSSTLTVALQANLSPAQVTAAKTAAYKAEAYYYTGPPRYNDYTWTGSWETAAGGLANTYDVRFVGDVELTVELTTSDPSNTLGGDLELVALPLNWKAGETANHFTDLAFDRLMGWQVLASASG
jgi:hypothetical protein